MDAIKPKRLIGRELITKISALLLIVVTICIFLVSAPVHAVWNGQPYAPGTTLEPECAPTQTDCSVRPPLSLDGNGNLILPGSLLPSSNGSLDLGSDGQRFRDLYLAGATLHIGDQTLSNIGGVLVWSGSGIETSSGNGSGGIASLNGLTATSQSFAVGSSGTDFNIVSSENVHVLNLPDASAAARGLLTVADWAVFSSKEPAITAGLAGQYYRGDKTWATLDTGAVPENGALYYTEARFDTAFAAKTTDSLSEGLASLYYTDARFDSRFALKATTNLAEGTNLYYTQARFDTAFSSKTTTNLAEGTALYFTDARARAALSAVSPLTYNSTTGAFSIPVASSLANGYLSSTDWATFNGKEPAITTGLTTQYYRGDKTFQTLDTSVVPENSNLYYTDARFDNRFALKTTTDLTEGLNLYYTQGRFDTALANKTTTNLAEGTALYFTDARARAALSAVSPLSYNSTTGIFSLQQATNLANGYLSSADWTTFNSKQSTVLTSGLIWVGNAANVATGVALSGDATLSNSGVLTLAASGVVGGSYGSLTQLPTFTVDSKGRLTAAGAVAVSSIGVAGDASGTLGAISVDKLKGTAINLTALASNNLLQFSGLAWVNVTPASLGSITLAVGLSGVDVNVTGSPASLGGTLTLNIPDASATARGLMTTGAQTLAGVKTLSSAPVISTMTPGSVLFTGASGVVAQDNGSLFWDDINNRIGLGTTAPNERLTVDGILALSEQSQPALASSNTGFGKIFVKQATGAGNDKYAILLLHLDGSGGSTQFIDSSGQQVAVSGVGSAALTATDPRFGTGSASFNGTTQYLTAPNNLNYDLLNNTATSMDLWFKPSSLTGIRPLVTYGSNSQSNYWSLRINGTQAEFIYRTTNQTRVNIIGGTVGAGVWQHIALVRTSGESYQLFLNGVSLGTGTATADSSYSGSLNIGADNSAAGSNFFGGQIDEVRLSQGNARYDSAFTPESSPYGTGLFYQLANGSLVEVQGGGAGGSGSTLDVNAFHKAGDAFGVVAKLGTTDNFALEFMTNGVVRGSFSASGEFSLLSAAQLAAVTATGATISQNGLTLASSTPAATTNALYNVSGTLFWSGSSVRTGSDLTGSAGQTITFDSSGQQVASSTIFVDSTNSLVGIGTTAPVSRLSVDGSLMLAGTARYLNFSAIAGATGYGIRDKNGVLEFRHSGGVWTELAAASGGGGSGTPLVGPEGGLITFDVFGDQVATTALFLSSSNFFGIGTTSPTNRLSVNGAITLLPGTPAATASALYNQSGTLYWNGTNVRTGNDLSGSEGQIIRFNASGAQAASSTLFITSGGDVGIGTTTPGGRLHLARADSAATLQLFTNSVNTSGLRVGVTGGGLGEVWLRDSAALVFGTADSERARIASSGFVGIGTNNPQVLLHVLRTGSGAVLRLQDDSATCDIAPANGALNCSSDIRLKRDVAALGTSLDKVLALNPVSFNWNGEAAGSSRHLGFIAQEVEELFPELVSTDERGYKSLSYSQFAPVLVKSIQELSQRVSPDALSAQVLATLATSDAIEIKGDLKIGGHLVVGSDTAGQVVIPAGQTSITVRFTKPYQAEPLIQLTPVNYNGGYLLKDVSMHGFTVEFTQPAAQDTKINWLTTTNP